jgi:hypothetical protein
VRGYQIEAINPFDSLMHIGPILNTMPKLESLDIHWSSLGSVSADSASASSEYSSGSRDVTDTSLRSCVLRGIYTTEKALLAFITAAKPSAIILKDIRLISGTYTSIFDHLAASDGSVSMYYLDDLRENNKLVHFKIPGRSKFEYLDELKGPSTLRKEVDDKKEVIRYDICNGWPRGSPEFMSWSKGKIQEYGAI